MPEAAARELEGHRRADRPDPATTTKRDASAPMSVLPLTREKYWLLSFMIVTSSSGPGRPAPRPWSSLAPEHHQLLVMYMIALRRRPCAVRAGVGRPRSRRRSAWRTRRHRSWGGRCPGHDRRYAVGA